MNSDFIAACSRHRGAGARLVAIVGTALAVTVADAGAQVCPGTTLIAGLRRPLGMALSNQGRLIVAETGDFAAHSGRLSILDAHGVRRTLLDGLPSGINDVAEPSGPAGLVMRGRTAFVLIGIGDAVLPGPIPGTHLPNPAVSSPIYSSVLAIHFSANVERTTAGFTMTAADQQALAAGRRLVLSNGNGDAIEVELVADFPDYVANPLPGFPQIVRGANPFSLVTVADQLFVTDGGLNAVWQVDVPTGTVAPLATFAPIPNPLPIGGPVTEAVPTGIEYDSGRLLVTLFRGVPFAPGTSSVVQVDPATGAQAPFVGGLKTAIDVLRTKSRSQVSYLILQHSSGPGPFFGGPGLVLHVDSSGAVPALVADCLSRPTAMALDEESGTLYVAELITGRIVALAVGP